MSRHFTRAVAPRALLLGVLIILPLAAAHPASVPRPASEVPSHCQTREALVREITGTGQLLAAYGYDDDRDDRYYVFLVFIDWTGALLKRDDRGLYCEANVLSREETLSLVAEIEASIGAGR